MLLRGEGDGVGQIALKHCGRWHAMADDIDAKEVGVRAPQIEPQGSHLARGAAEEHLTPGLKKLLGLGIGCAYTGLEVFGASEAMEMARVLDIVEHGMPIIIPTDAENDAALTEHLLGKEGENAP